MSSATGPINTYTKGKINRWNKLLNLQSRALVSHAHLCMAKYTHSFELYQSYVNEYYAHITYDLPK